MAQSAVPMIIPYLHPALVNLNTAPSICWVSSSNGAPTNISHGNFMMSVECPNFTPILGVVSVVNVCSRIKSDVPTFTMSPADKPPTYMKSPFITAYILSATEVPFTLTFSGVWKEPIILPVAACNSIVAPPRVVEMVKW